MWLYPLLSMGLFGILFGAGLAFASKKFAVKTDPRVLEVLDALPGANCGACGFAGCAGYAGAVVSGDAAPNLCSPGGPETTQNICEVLGVEVETSERTVAMIRCQGAKEAVKDAEYQGARTCALATMIAQGPIACKNACLMLGDCFAACPFGAIEWKAGQLPHIIEEKCTACRKCITACPKALIALRPVSKRVQIMCRSQDKGGVAKKKCQVACIGCQKCIKACPVDAISMDGNVALVDSEKCILCGKCVSECPTGAIWDGRPPRKPKKTAEPQPAEAVTA
jgi:RnfABCDGE-type electron transport complex B subunit